MLVNVCAFEFFFLFSFISSVSLEIQIIGNDFQHFLILVENSSTVHTFWISVMSSSLMTLFFFEDPDLELELSKHRQLFG